MAKDQPATTPTPPAADKPSLVGRLLAPIRSLRARPLRTILMSLPLVAIIGALASGYLMFSPRAAEKPTLELALAKLAAGENDEARRMAAELRAAPNESFSTVGGAFFVLGSVMAGDAQRHENASERQTLYLIASRYLEESRIRGFPREHEAEGLLLLGRSLHHGGRFAASILILKEALARRPASRAEIYELLADAHLHLDPPKLDQAAHYCRLLLAEKHLPPERRDSGTLLQGRIALAQGRFAEGQKGVAQIPATSIIYPSAIILSIRLLAEEARAELQDNQPQRPETRQSLEDGLKTLAKLRVQSRAPAELKTQAELLSAICLELLGRKPEALVEYASIRKARFGTPEAVAAAFLEAELQQRSGDSEQAISLYKRALTDAGSAETYQNDWLPLAALEARLLSALKAYFAAEDYARATQLARALTPLFAEEIACEWRARSEEAWAVALAKEAAKKSWTKADADRRKAREHYRKAGVQYERLAELRIATPSYLDDLIKSAAAYREGQSFPAAIRIFRAILEEDAATGRAEALTGLGEALLAAGRTDEGLEILTQCRNLHPKHPATYRARALSSLGYQELGKLTEARQMLVDNLYNYSLTPESSDWRDSLFLLAKVVYREALSHEVKSRQDGVDSPSSEIRKVGLKELEKSYELFQEAIQLLEEAVERYPTAPQTTEARYLLAESRRQSAKWPRKRMDSTAIEASKGSLNREMQDELAAALKEYTLLIEHLGDETDGAGADNVDQAILRNSYFGRADVLFDQGKFEDALAAYSAATNRYQHEPVALEAYVQIAACYRRMGRPTEARGTLEQARVVFSRMNADANFTKTTPYTREEWNRLLTRLSSM